MYTILDKETESWRHNGHSIADYAAKKGFKPANLLCKTIFFPQLSACMILNGLIDSLVLVLLLWRRAAGLQHLLQQVELDSRLALVLGDGQVIRQVVVAHQAGESIPKKLQVVREGVEAF